MSTESRSLALDGCLLLLATDGDPASTAAPCTAAHLAHALGAVPMVVHALEPSAPQGFLDDPCGQAARALRATLAESVADAVAWPIHVAVGLPASVIVRRARELHAALIVVGVHRHGPLQRALHGALHDETALHVMRCAPCPVLGVVQPLDAPRRAVVGVDFGVASVRAASAMLALLAAGSTMELVYVASADAADEPIAESDERATYAVGVDAAFDRLIADLAAPHGVAVRAARLCGGENGRAVGLTLRAYADACGADVIALGSRRHDLVDRLLLGSVTQTLARDGRHSLLVVPPAPALAHRSNHRITSGAAGDLSCA